MLHSMMFFILCFLSKTHSTGLGGQERPKTGAAPARFLFHQWEKEQKKHPEGCLSLVFHEFHSANQIVFDRLVGCCVTENEVQHGLTWFQHGFMVIESSTFRHRRLVLIELSTLKRKLMPIIVPSQKLFSKHQ